MILKLLRFHSNYCSAAILLIMFCAILASIVSMTKIANAAPNGQSSATGHYYYVESGDTLSDIAQFYGFSTEELMYANALSNANHIHSGDRLYIPARSAQYGQLCRHYHWVESGHTLSWVAVHYGIDAHALAQANNIYDHDHVEIGTSLCIPALSGSPVEPPVTQQQPPARPLYQQPSTPVPPTATPYIPPSPTINPLNDYPKPNGYVYYTLQSGDTLRSLAANYRTSEHHLSLLNPGELVAPGITWLLPLYGDVPMPPTATPLFYPTITPMPLTSTPLFYPTLAPKSNATPRPLSPRTLSPTPVPSAEVEINITPSTSQQGSSIEASSASSQIMIATTTGSIATSTARVASPTATSTAGATPPTSTPTLPTPIPESSSVVNPWVGQYYINPNLRGEPLYENRNSNINFDWGTGGPGYGLPNDKFSIRWMTHEQLEAGHYTFRIYVEGGLRLYVDGELLLNRWQDNSGNYAAEVDLKEGYHTLQVDYGKFGSTAHIRVWWTKK